MVTESLYLHARTIPDKRAFAFFDSVEREQGQLTYAELHNRATAIALLLLQHHEPGARVLLLYPPGLDYIAAFFGCLYAGIIAVPAYPPNPAQLARTLPRLQAILADAQAETVLTTSTILSMSELLFMQAPSLRELKWFSTSDTSIDGDVPTLPPAKSDQVAFLQYTSGSTGNPKGVRVTHGNLAHNSRVIETWYGHTPELVGTGWLPLYHDMGLIGYVLQPVHMGGFTALMSPLSFLKHPLLWLRAISKYRASTSGGPNFAFDLCVRKAAGADLSGLDLSSWKVAFNGAEPVRAETLDRFAETFAPYGFDRRAFLPCYGLAESTLMVTCARYGEGPRLLHAEDGVAATTTDRVSAGVPCDQRVLVVDPATRTPRADGVVGEIWVAGESVADGYWNNPDATRDAFGARLGDGDGPFLRTGDLGTMRDGELIVTGRIKDLIIVRGRNLFPSDIERVAEGAGDGIREGCSAAFAIERGGEERVVVVAELKTGFAGDLVELTQAMRAAIASEFETEPLGILLVRQGGISKTSSGKVQRGATREAYRAGTLPIVSEWTDTASSEPASAPAAVDLDTAPGLRAWLLSTIAQRLNVAPDALDLTKHILAYGIDSLARLELQDQLESTLLVDLSSTDLFESPSLAVLLDRICDKVLGSDAAEDSAPIAHSPAAFELHAPRPATVPLSALQQIVWRRLSRTAKDLAFVHLYRFSIRGTLDVDAFARAFRRAVTRHEGLRTRFQSAKGVVSQVLGDAPEIELVELRSEVPDERVARSSAAWAQERARPIAPQKEPIFRARLLALDETEHALFFAVHELVWDARSACVFFAELGASYDVERGQASTEPAAPKAHSADFALHNRRLAEDETLCARRRAFWRRQLLGSRRLHRLPCDRARPTKETLLARTVHARLSSDTALRLSQYADREGWHESTPYLAAFHAVLRAYGSSDDACIGVTISLRPRDLDGAVGLLSSRAAVRVRSSGAMSLRELGAAMDASRSEAVDSADVPLQRLVPERQATSRLDQVRYAYDEVGPPVLRLGELDVTLVQNVERTTVSDLLLEATNAAGTGSLALSYKTEIFDAGRIDALLGSLVSVCERWANDPEATLDSLHIEPATSPLPLSDF